MSGQIRYQANALPVSGVTVNLQGAAALTTATDANGQFDFTGLSSTPWQIQPQKLGDTGNAISALDAVYVLQAVVGLRTLSAAQQLACDVSGNGSVSAFDASLILQYVVGLISRFPVARNCGSDWAFVPVPAAAANQQLIQPQVVGTCQPGAIGYQPLTGSATGQDFSAVLFGDCTGNWQPSPPPQLTATPSATTTTTATVTATATATASRSATPTATTTRTPTRTSTATATATWTPSLTPTTAGTPSAPVLGGCAVFPPDNPWNRDVSADPVDPNSANYIASINLNATKLHPDFGSPADYGIPYVIVPGTQPMVPITFDAYGDESDPGPYPVPSNAPVEAGSDHHVLVLNAGSCILYELFAASKDTTGSGWTAASGAIFDLHSNALRTDSWTSADAAGLPILAGLVRYDEVAAGEIKHAVRFTVWRAQRAWVHPATHYGVGSSLNDPPMGARLRLKASYDISTFTGESRVILAALKKYGMFVADAGSSWYITGATDPRWDDNDLNQLKTVPGSAFEVVQLGTIYRP